MPIIEIRMAEESEIAILKSAKKLGENSWIALFTS